MKVDFQCFHSHVDQYAGVQDDSQHIESCLETLAFNSILDVHGWLGCPWHQLAALKRYMLKKWNA